MHGSTSRWVRSMSLMARVAIPLLLATAYGCTGSPVGDPCVPESVPSGGYDDREVYLETSSVQCRTRTCMVYHLEGDPSTAAGADEQIFCSCRCSVLTGASANTPLCNCGDGYTCVDDIVTTGGEGVQGGYCVPCIREDEDRNLPSPPFDNCPTPG